MSMSVNILLSLYSDMIRKRCGSVNMVNYVVLCLDTLRIVRFTIDSNTVEGSGPERYISGMLYSRGRPFWSGTLVL